MKKIIIAMLVAMIHLGTQAQTNFRSITYQQALAAAKTENKMVFMDFYTDWCGPCKLMAREVFPQKLVGDFFNSRFVCLKVNAEKGEGIALAKQYKPTAYPTFIIITPGEKEVGRTEGYRQADQFVEHINQLVDTTLTPQRMKALYEQGDRSPRLVKAYAASLIEELRKRGHRVSNYAQRLAEIRKMVQDYFVPLSDKQKLSSDNLFVYRAYTSRTTDPAARFMMSHRGQFGADNALIDSTLYALYQRELCDYLSASIDYDAQAFARFGNEMTALGLDKDAAYAMVVKMVEAARQGMDSYLAAFDRHFAQLPVDLRYPAMSGIVNRYGKADKATSRKASQHIRNFMPDMDINLLYAASMSLYELEGPRH